MIVKMSDINESNFTIGNFFVNRNRLLAQIKSEIGECVNLSGNVKEQVLLNIDHISQNINNEPISLASVTRNSRSKHVKRRIRRENNRRCLRSRCNNGKIVGSIKIENQRGNNNIVDPLRIGRDKSGNYFVNLEVERDRRRGSHRPYIRNKSTNLRRRVRENGTVEIPSENSLVKRELDFREMTLKLKECYVKLEVMDLREELSRYVSKQTLAPKTSSENEMKRLRLRSRNDSNMQPVNNERNIVERKSKPEELKENNGKKSCLRNTRKKPTTV